MDFFLFLACSLCNSKNCLFCKEVIMFYLGTYKHNFYEHTEAHCRNIVLSDKISRIFRG